MQVELLADGAAEPVMMAFTTIGTRASARGWDVRAANPADLAAGSGRFEIDVPNVDTWEEARAGVQALIDEIPANDVIKIVDQES